MTTIDTVLLDADGVFQRAPADFLLQLSRAALGPDAAENEPMLMEIFAAEELALAGAADFAVTVDPVLKKWNAVCTPDAFMRQWEAIDTDHSVLALVAELRRAGVTCAIASNQQHYRATHMSERLGYAGHFDHEFYSYRLGHAKPSPDYFRAILKQGGFDPARTLFLDDRIANVEGARSVGMHAAHFVLGPMGEGAAQMRAVLRSHGIDI